MRVAAPSPFHFEGPAVDTEMVAREVAFALPLKLSRLFAVLQVAVVPGEMPQGLSGEVLLVGPLVVLGDTVQVVDGEVFQDIVGFLGESLHAGHVEVLFQIASEQVLRIVVDEER